MAAGMPVAAMDVGDVATIVSSGNRSFIVGSEAELAVAISTLAADPDLRRRLGDANRSLARACYDERTMIERYERLYATALACRR